jgi:RHS repeat-associated protein
MIRTAVLAVGLMLVTSGLASAQTDQVTYYHTDAVGSVRMITDQNGQVVARYDYLPFGEPWNPPTSPDPRQFAGKERDQETGFDYFGARYYASQMGRFTTVDPGHVGGDPANPQSWNGCSYALNNPLRFVDPRVMAARLRSGAPMLPRQVSLMAAPSKASAYAERPTVGCPAISLAFWTLWPGPRPSKLRG